MKRNFTSFVTLRGLVRVPDDLTTAAKGLCHYGFESKLCDHFRSELYHLSIKDVHSLKAPQKVLQKSEVVCKTLEPSNTDELISKAILSTCTVSLTWNDFNWLAEDLQSRRRLVLRIVAGVGRGAPRLLQWTRLRTLIARLVRFVSAGRTRALRARTARLVGCNHLDIIVLIIVHCCLFLFTLFRYLLNLLICKLIMVLYQN